MNTLDKFDLICLIRGLEVCYDLMGHNVVGQCGRFIGSYDRWDWYSHSMISNKFSEAELLKAYQECKAILLKNDN